MVGRPAPVMVPQGPYGAFKKSVCRTYVHTITFTKHTRTHARDYAERPYGAFKKSVCKACNTYVHV